VDLPRGGNLEAGLCWFWVPVFISPCKLVVLLVSCMRTPISEALRGYAMMSPLSSVLNRVSKKVSPLLVRSNGCTLIVFGVLGQQQPSKGMHRFLLCTVKQLYGMFFVRRFLDSPAPTFAGVLASRGNV
jgi:hypothetical protein